MVTIKKNILNKVGFTLRELAICDEPMEFVFDFTSENSESIACTITKTPVNLGERLQVFEFDEGTEITFPLQGYYNYEIRQTTSNNIVEVGLIRVVGEDTTVQTMTNAKNPQVYGS